MGDFAFTEEQQAVRSSVAAFAGSEVAPLAAGLDHPGARYPVELLERMGELGYLGARFGAEHGGSGAGVATQAIIFEELAAASGGVALGAYVHTALALTGINALGTDEQKSRYLVPGIRGRRIGAWGMTEASAGSDIAALTTRAEPDGDGWRLEGAKLFTTNGSFADFIVVSAVTDPAAGPRGVSLFIVEREAGGVEVAQRLETVGMRPAETVELLLVDAPVSHDNLLGPLGGGLGAALSALAEGRIYAASYALGLARTALEAALRHARERVQFGRSISSFQAVSFPLADAATDLDAARLLTRRAAWLADTGRPFKAEGSMAKLFATEAASRIASRAIQIHGGYGYVLDSVVQRVWRDAKLLEIGEGTSEIHRGIVARSLGLEAA